MTDGRARLRRISISDASSTLPDPTPFVIESDERFDLYLGALGFEDRCTSLPRALADAGAGIGTAVFAEYATNAEENEANRLEYETSLNSIAKSVHGLGTGVRHYEKQLADVLDDMRGHSVGPMRVLLDISVASNHLVMASLKLLLDRADDVHLTVGYAEAESYLPSKDEFELNAEQWTSPDTFGLEAGVGEIDVMVEYPGYHVDGLPDTVVVIAGFGRDRARAAISWVNPSFLTSPGDRLVWLLGQPLHAEDLWRREALARIHNTGDSVTLPLDTFDYRETLRRLDALFEQLGDSRQLTLVPLGSKMQALGAALYCYGRPEVRVIFAAPARYRGSRYSVGCRQLWRVDLGPVRRLRTTLDSVGHLQLAPPDV